MFQVPCQYNDVLFAHVAYPLDSRHNPEYKVLFNAYSTVSPILLSMNIYVKQIKLDQPWSKWQDV